MDETRHHHPHIDPRQPRDGARPQTNPPVFAWKPQGGQEHFWLTVARDEALSDVVLQIEDLEDPMFLPTNALEPGRYWWTWGSAAGQASTFSFDVGEDAVTVEVPGAAEWLKRLPEGHPRIYVRPEQIEAIRASREDLRAEQWAELKQLADELLAEDHEIEEPPFLPDRQTDYRAFFQVWGPIMWESRRFVKGAEVLALAWLASGDERYARAACERLASISQWDPEGSSHISHNDEAHMSVIWHGSKAADWVWDQFTDEERARVIEQYRRRGEITFEHMHDRGCYGVTRFDSHAGREIVFLALLGMVFHEHIPAARRWLDWLRPVLCGIWPVWAGDDGAWAEGPSYGLAYVNIMTMFATALKRGCYVDLYRRPFWAGHARWRHWCFPPYAEWMGFGDHSERWRGTWLANGQLVARIARETDAPAAIHRYAEEFLAEAETLEEPPSRSIPRFSAQDYLAEPAQYEAAAVEQERASRIFPAAGWAAVRTMLEDRSRDIALIFRSSPFGAISHSHANNNDFVIHVAGKCIAMPAGYYDGYASNHHANYVWHTKSHNCVTLSDAGQLMRSHESVGAIENGFEDDRIVYMRGTADASYAQRARRCRRHVVYLKDHGAFFMVDEFVAQPGIVSALEWNIHSWNEFQVDEQARTFTLRRDGSRLEASFLYHQNAFFVLDEGWEPRPNPDKPSDQWYNQYHLRFVPAGLVESRNLGVVLAAGHEGLEPAEVQTERIGNAEIARIDDDLLAVNMGSGIAVEDITSEALALMILGGQSYEITDDGVVVL